MQNDRRRTLSDLIAQPGDADLDRLDGVPPRPQRVTRAAQIETSDDHDGSVTQAHLGTTFLDERMRARGKMASRVHGEYYRDAPGVDVEQREAMLLDAVERETKLAPTHVAFYHAQPPEMRLAQDVYKRLYELHHGVELPKDFQFLRFPAPDGSEFTQHANATAFVASAMHEHGLIDDHTPGVRENVVAANFALHGNFGHPGEETFGFFLRGESPSKPDVERLMGSYLEKFGYPTPGLKSFIGQAGAHNQTQEGSVLQILVPKQQVDALAYVSQMRGLPHDDALVNDLHRYGAIEYGRPGAGHDGGLEREPLEDELERKLDAIKARWGTSPTNPREAHDAELARELHDRTLEKLRAGEFRPSRVVDALKNDPQSLRHARADEHAERVARNPEHFNGQGSESADEVNQIRNRPNTIQARLLMSARPGGTLDPNSGVIVARYDTRTPEQTRQYEDLVDRYVTFLEKAKTLQVSSAVQSHNERDGGKKLPLPQRVRAWDGRSHEGTVVQLDEAKFAVHTGRGEYTMLPPQRDAQETRRQVGRVASVNRTGEVQPLQQGRSRAR